jgi:3-oxoacyl-[acyl-carrier protein] reductase
VKRFEGRNVLVTGSSQGIGAAIAERIGSEGANVAVNYYPGNLVDAEQVCARIAACGGTAVPVEGDVSDSASCVSIVEQTVEKLGSLDVLVNNAGITRDGLMVRMSDEDWKAVIDINLSGVFYMTRAAGKVMMKAREGVIVNIASVVGIGGNAGQANYAAAKAGVIGLTKTTARELAGRGVRCNAVAPGFIETAMTAKLPVEARTAIAAQIALGRLGGPADIASAVAFLASDDASYVTGHTLVVDGGMTFA